MSKFSIQSVERQNFLEYSTIQYSVQYNITLLPSVNTLIARGMFCGAKYTHHTFTPVIKHLNTTTTAKKRKKKTTKNTKTQQQQQQQHTYKQQPQNNNQQQQNVDITHKGVN